MESEGLNTLGSSLYRMSTRPHMPFVSNSHAIRQEIQRFESVHPSIYAIYDLIEHVQDPALAQQIREHVVCIEDSFVNSQEWTLSRAVPDLRLGIVGSLSSGKSALVHRYLTGSYMQEESPEGGRFKKEMVLDGQSYLLLIRDEGGPPELQFSTWVDAVIFVFSLENESSFNAIYHYYSKMNFFRNTAEIPIILVGTQDAISETNPRIIDDSSARKLAGSLKHCSYFETCATYGLNVETVFQVACQKVIQQRSLTGRPAGSRPTTPSHMGRYQSAAAFLPSNGHSPPPPPAPASSRDSPPQLRHSQTPVKELSLRQAHSMPPPPHELHMPPPPAPAPGAVTRSDSLRGDDGKRLLASGESQPHLPTPSSTPTTGRKNRRRSNLFAPSRKAGDEERRLKTAELGSGRAIPIKQGYLYKRSQKALNKDWKKKYVTISDDGKLTYHASLHEYMEDAHGKEICLQYTTVKVPGQRPRGSKSIPNANNNTLADNISNLTLNSSGSLPGHTRAKDKVTLTAYEALRDPAAPVGRDEALLSNCSLSLANGAALTADTPNVKKRHRRVKSSGVRSAADDVDSDGYEFSVVSLDNKVWHFEAGSQDERDEWVAVIEQQILTSLQGNESSKSKSRMNSLVDPASIQTIKNSVPGNTTCVDCAAPNPDWASLNLGALMCIECSGIHRNLGSHVSRVRSLDLDEWPPGHLAVMLALGNTAANAVWEGRVPAGRVRPGAGAGREEKERWIRAKYERRELLAPAPAPAELSQLLVDAVCRSDVRDTAQLLVHCAPEHVNAAVSAQDARTPLHLAAALCNLAIVQLLLWHGADVHRLDTEGRTCLAFARSAGPAGAPVADLLRSAGCPEPAAPGAGAGAAAALSRRRGSLTPREAAGGLL
ncbi:centaurin-gamma-1A-like [Amphibalanus amphitrite]|uniref:centaurin-gamma-1A-like n=1 Tax=Amphibalanus amphitrite TaxID=1232801 RepID=UPI001C91406F|nr:centaurin-gamma-1A-like [Amphibalanus amphitrite]